MQRDAIPLDEYRKGEWGDPVSLPDLLPTAPDLPEDLLPESLRPWLMDAAERSQCPIASIAAPAIVGLSSLIGLTVGVRPKQADSWLVVPNLWGCLVGRPGAMKTPSISEGISHLSRLAARAAENFEAEADQAEARATVLKAEQKDLEDQLRKAIKGHDKGKLAGIENDLVALSNQLRESQPSERRYVVNDTTTEKLGALLNENPRGLLLERDELIGWLRNMDRAGREGDREFFLEAWNGSGRFTCDRIGRGTLHIKSLCLSVFGGAQPGKLQNYISGALSGGAGDDGLLQRLQVIVWPEAQGKWRNVDRGPDIDARDIAAHVFESMDALNPDQLGIEGHGEDIPALRFTPEAQEVFNDWRGCLETRLRGSEFVSCPAFESHLAKYRSLMPSLALIFHLVEVVAGREVGAVSSEAANRAIKWCTFLEAHARKVYAAEINSDTASTHAFVEKIKSGHIEDGQRIRDIYRRGWSGLANAEAVHNALDLAERHNLIRIEEVETEGRPGEVIRFNPKWENSMKPPRARTDRADKSPSGGSVSSISGHIEEKESAA